jgi:SAM-dependent methyltransferase
VTNPFSLLGKNWLVWRIGRAHLRSVAHLARGRTLDIGCGWMPMVPVFDGRIDRLVGLDRPRPEEPGRPVSVLGDARRLPFRSESFDTALCLQVLEHLPEPEESLREAHRVLRPGGHLLLTAPHIWNVHEAPDDYFRFTLYGLRHLFGKAGFEVVEVRAMAGYFVTTAARFCYLLAHLDRWGLQILIRPLYFLTQVIGWGLDRIYCDRSETWNYLAVGRKRGR